MNTHLKKLYHQFIGGKIDNDSFNEFKESINKASDDELWDMISSWDNSYIIGYYGSDVFY